MPKPKPGPEQTVRDCLSANEALEKATAAYNQVTEALREKRKDPEWARLKQARAVINFRKAWKRRQELTARTLALTRLAGDSPPEPGPSRTEATEATGTQRSPATGKAPATTPKPALTTVKAAPPPETREEGTK